MAFRYGSHGMRSPARGRIRLAAVPCPPTPIRHQRGLGELFRHRYWMLGPGEHELCRCLCTHVVLDPVLQVVLLLLVAPFFLTLGRPMTITRNALPQWALDGLSRAVPSTLARTMTHPLTTSLAMLATPWLLYLTPWYTASLTNGALGAATRIMLVLIGFSYFYARLQVDPVPRRYPQLISLLISVAETIGDGVLGLVLWQGPLVASTYYLALHRSWGPDLRTDQTIGAGILWILGDVLGLPFLVLLMRALSADDRAHAAQIDAELDRVGQSPSATATAPAQDLATSTLWWENDPQLRDRFGRH